MANAQIQVKELFPLANDQSIGKDTIFTFRLFPMSGTTIDITTLAVSIIVSGSNGNFTYTLGYNDSEVTYTSNGSSYNIEIDVDPDGINFSSKESVTLKINVSDSDGNAMRQLTTSYMVADDEQLGALKELTEQFTEISINNEEARIYNASTATFTWDNWNSDKDIYVYKNNMRITSGYSINYLQGKITFDPDISTGYNKTDIFNSSFYQPIDIITADYNYSLFTDAELIKFLKIALSEYNAQKPQTGYSISFRNSAVQGSILIGAAYYLYNAVVAGFINQQWRVQWGEEEEWEKALEIAKTEKENMKSRWEFLLEAKSKKLAHPMGIVVPEYTLPGGRSRFFTYLFGQGGTF